MAESREFANLSQTSREIASSSGSLIVTEPGYLQMDLADMQKYSQWNGGTKFLLFLCDTFSKWLWVEPCGPKNATEIERVLSDIWKTLKFPVKTVYCDQGTEFVNGTLSALSSDFKIKFVFARVAYHAPQAERAIGTIKLWIQKHMLDGKTRMYVSILPTLVRNFNNLPNARPIMAPCGRREKCAARTKTSL